jgi:murein DD-endopeptidase MepM/ murein hydrolase activator NlpD
VRLRDRLPAARLPRLALPAAVLVLVAASSSSVAQRVPRWFFPTVAIAGAPLILFSLATSGIRLVRRYREDGRLRVLPVVANLVAAMFFVVVPSTRWLRLVTAPEGGAPRILAGFGEWLGGEGYPRLSPHRGVDVAGPVGADVLAVVAGRVVVARDSGGLCGLIVAISHDPHGYRTIYCHLSAIAVSPGETVARGQRIGALGTTGQRAWPGYEHVHLELQRGDDAGDVEDPLPRIVGCFDAARRYPEDRLVLTYPVRC